MGTKVVINRCYGGFGLSEKASKMLNLPISEEMVKKYPNREYLWYDASFYRDPTRRTDPSLVKCVENLGKEASGECANLKVVEIPDSVEFYIDEDLGWEVIHEKHRIWGEDIDNEW